MQFYANWLTNTVRDGRYVDGRTDYLGAEAADRPSIGAIKAQLQGKNLACWCPLGQPCHADVLLAIANG